MSVDTIMRGAAPIRSRRPMLPLGLLAVEAAFLAVTHVAGGPPWTVVAAIGFAALAIGGRRPDVGWREPLWLILPSLFWVAAFRASGYRQLFFPFAMYLACHAILALSHRGRMAAGVAGSLVVAAFLVIRIAQAATLPVLAVEAAAAGVILAVAAVVIARRDRSLFGDGLILQGVAVAACIALAL